VFPCAAPLLEEKCHPLFAALTTDVDDPVSKHGPGVRAALAADDHPVDSAQIKRAEIGQEGFDGQESNARWSLPQRTNTRQAVPPILNADAEGDVIEIGYPTQLFPQQFS
jgi:hypothetical protein